MCICINVKFLLFKLISNQSQIEIQFNVLKLIKILL